MTQKTLWRDKYNTNVSSLCDSVYRIYFKKKKFNKEISAPYLEALNYLSQIAEYRDKKSNNVAPSPAYHFILAVDKFTSGMTKKPAKFNPQKTPSAANAWNGLKKNNPETIRSLCQTFASKAVKTCEEEKKTAKNTGTIYNAILEILNVPKNDKAPQQAPQEPDMS